MNSAVEISAGVFTAGSNVPVESVDLGRVTSVGTGSLSGRTIDFSFSDLDFGDYQIGVYSLSGIELIFWYLSDTISLSGAAPEVGNFSDAMSFSGPAPWGTVSGIVLLSGDWPGDRLVFVGIAPHDNPSEVLQWIVIEDDLSEGKYYFNFESIAYGQYLVGFYGYDSTTHQVDTYGAFDDPVTVAAENPYVSSVNFPSDFAGDPGTDPELGSVSGTVTFTGPLPEGLPVWVAANTIPPQVGSPPSTFQVFADQIGSDNTLDYSLGFLPDDEYSVSIFSYDIIQHQATYFGEYNGTVAIDAGNQNVTGIDFTADVSLLP
ncbi:hypothetical protein IIA79_04655 [bacterium]|nr:hypothetical protein [bacterium]